MNLVPCPFCGSKNPLFNIAQARPGDKPSWYDRCRSSKCAARIEAGTAPAAMKRWNTRPVPSPSDTSDTSDTSDNTANTAQP